MQKKSVVEVAATPFPLNPTQDLGSISSLASTVCLSVIYISIARSVNNYGTKFRTYID